MFFFIKGKPNDIKVALDIVNIPRLDEKDEVSIYDNIPTVIFKHFGVSICMESFA